MWQHCGFTLVIIANASQKRPPSPPTGQQLKALSKLHMRWLGFFTITSLLSLAAAAPTVTETAQNATKQPNFTYVVLYNNAAQGAAFRTGELYFKPGADAYLYPIQLLPGYDNLPGHSIVWQMYKHGSAPGEYTFVNKDRGDNLLYSPGSLNLVTSYGRGPTVFELQPAEDGTYLIKIPNQDAVAQALVDTPKDYTKDPVDIHFSPQNGSPYQRWTIGKMVGDSDWEWEPWNP
ncbi:hypothetical protein MIND_00663400 [Mycena indigotica]|uniref:Uncharacterized protein n=1 Tax=Mycena indigotica TaxID=2126181 RepID=A0A8H6SNE9_9AGAR|nr:uncharacterized protein MIND_00663400 [Mycena indigotica]KAF7301000.1 hypothetical protein MIND_00663400 [Mycena indigotica]